MTSQGYGYDEEFVDAPPEYLKCIVCYLVLKDPVQVIECGHHYCSGCFDRLEGYSSNFNSELSCPVDRKPIDLTKVTKDKFVERLVLDLQVKCSFTDDGCTWVGELRNIEDNQSKCSGEEVGAPSTELLKQMSLRLDRCEDSLLEKEKDVAYVKFEMKEAKEKLLKKDEEVEFLKQRMLNCEESLLKKSEEVEFLKQKMANYEETLLKQELLKARVWNNEKILQKKEQDAELFKKKVMNAEEGMLTFKTKVLHTEEDQRLHVKDVEGLKREVEKLRRRMLECENKSNLSKQDVKNLRELNKEEIESLKTGLKLRDNHVDSLKGQVKELKKAEEKPRNAAALSEKRGKSDESGRGGAIAKKDSSLKPTGAVSLHNKQNVFVWRTNVNKWTQDVYKYSPVFYCHPKGHPCKIAVRLHPDKQVAIYFTTEGDDSLGKVNFNLYVELILTL